jgi:hypothetical protein
VVKEVVGLSSVLGASQHNQPILSTGARLTTPKPDTSNDEAEMSAAKVAQHEV